MNAENPDVEKIKTNNDVTRFTDNSNQYEQLDPAEKELPNSVHADKSQQKKKGG